jgi:hypothetical protein
MGDQSGFARWTDIERPFGTGRTLYVRCWPDSTNGSKGCVVISNKCAYAEE